MSRRRRTQRQTEQTSMSEATQAEAPQDDPMHEGVVLVRKGLGHAAVWVRLPASVIEAYATRSDPPDLRSVVVDRLIHWVSRVP